MKLQRLLLALSCSWAAITSAQTPPPVYQAPAAAPEAQTAPAAPLRSAADLEKLVAPIALYPDPLIATMLPASVYPLEIVQAARFVKDTNNLAKLDAQPWDANVKAVARVPDLIQKMNADLTWTMELGEAFLAQDKDLFDAIQRMRGKAQTIGTLKTTPQQIVTVTNIVVEKTIEQQVVVVTNTIVQVQPSNPQVVYVPTYNPAVVYYPPPPAYVGPPPVVSFAAGVAVGAIIANNCDWHHGGCYGGYGNVDIDVNNVNINRNQNINANRNVNNNLNGQRSGGAGQKWQPDQSRLSKSGSPTAAASARTGEARGYGSKGAGPSTANAGSRAAAGSAGARPTTAQASARPSSPSPSANRPSASPSASRPSPSASPAASRPSPSPSATQSRPSPAASSSAFSGASGGGGDARSASSRGASSRSSGGGRSAGGRSGGGGGGRR